MNKAEIIEALNGADPQEIADAIGELIADGLFLNSQVAELGMACILRLAPPNE